ncbi:hypothetical protein QOZ80_6AG0524100 [Eleusine coracana subsp. coracana]|nr:hypothetical protein QOZ80_6AG0524100 [Eleusine coracana subsp. coracana]
MHAACHSITTGFHLKNISMAVSVLLQLAVAVELLCAVVASALNQDGILLLSFKLSLGGDPLGSLSDWAPYTDATPCSWNGIVCDSDSRVVSVVLPNAQLVGPVARELGFVECLRHLDLSGNALNGSVPGDLFRAPELRVLSLAGNGLTGPLPEPQAGQLRSLRALNLAGNALSGAVPRNLVTLPNLTAVSLAGNFFSGEVPGGEVSPALQILDVSANLLNGTLPADLGGAGLRYVNLSSNRIAGGIPAEMAARLPANVTIDLSYNNLTGAVPAVAPFSTQRADAFEGNAELCGAPLQRLCSFASASAVEPKSPPAIAAIPKQEDPTTEAASSSGRKKRLVAIAAIAVGDVAGVAVLFLVALYVYRLRRKRKQRTMGPVVFKKPDPEESPDAVGRSLSCCLRNNNKADDSDRDVTDTSPSFAAKEENTKAADVEAGQEEEEKKKKKKKGVVVTVDGEGEELELETLLKASAYILGSAGGSIVYKAVLADGAVLAVRRIGSDDAAVRRFADLDAHMRAVAKLRHGNVLRLRGFYWGPDEMLIIHDLAVNGSLANLSVKRKPGSSPVNLGWSARLRIARGVARALAFLHDKKWVHGNVKPSNVLLDADMEPLLADLGMDRLVRTTADSGSHQHMSSVTTTAFKFGTKRSAKSLPDQAPASPLPSDDHTAAHYRAPEKTKPSAKWDVYAFGVLLLELLAGRALTSLELCQCAAAPEENKAQAMMRMADPALRAEMGGREEAVASCLRLGAACCNLAPTKRPSMRDALQAIDRIPALASATASSSSSSREAAGAR